MGLTLENQLERKLNLPTRCRRIRDYAGTGTARPTGHKVPKRGKAKVRMVQNIKEFRAELKVGSLAQVKILL